MKPKYVVINEKDRNYFEKKYEIPYGYGECDVHVALEFAIDELVLFYNKSEWIVEEITDAGRETVYRGGVQEA